MESKKNHLERGKLVLLIRETAEIRKIWLTKIMNRNWHLKKFKKYEIEKKKQTVLKETKKAKNSFALKFEKKDMAKIFLYQQDENVCCKCFLIFTNLLFHT